METLNSIQPVEAESVDTLPPPVEIVIEEDAREYIEKKNFSGDLPGIFQRLTTLFNPERITVDFTPNYSDGNSEEGDLGFVLRCEYEEKQFEADKDRFYEPYRREKPPIYFYMVVEPEL